VILSPHALCWTDECFLGNGRSACEAILDYAAGRVPKHVVNREVLQRAGMQAKLKRFAAIV
jgi:D-3-phosphoglycerate dehydrogenase